MIRQIISIGGGGFSHSKSDLKLEKYILAQSEASKPKICMLPQASCEDQAYLVKFYDTFHRLGAEPTWLSLFGRVDKHYPEKLLDQDIIYVGGGNTKSMLALWQAWGIDFLLKQAYENGAVLAGVSAGAICWFEHCVTDSVWPLGMIEGLGFLKGSCCPHYDSEPERAPTFRQMVKDEIVSPGIALDDFTAAHYVDGDLKHVISAGPTQNAYRLDRDSETVLTPLRL